MVYLRRRLLLHPVSVCYLLPDQMIILAFNIATRLVLHNPGSETGSLLNRTVDAWMRSASGDSLLSSRPHAHFTALQLPHSARGATRRNI